MRVSHLSLTNFRNYARLELSIPEGVVVLHGDNAQGKTSLLEAIYYLATSRSPYTNSDRQLINWLAEEDPLPFARLDAEIRTAQGIKRIEIAMMLEKQGRQVRFKKQIRINGLNKRVMDLLGQIRVVMFLPQDMELVEGSPSHRRRYLDVTLCQADTEYCRALSQYDKTLSQRNALLRQFQEQRGRGDMTQLDFWDERLALHAGAIVAGRYRLVRELEQRAADLHRELSGAGEHLSLRYEPGFDASARHDGQMSFAAGDLGVHALPQLEPAKLTGRFVDALRANRREDILRGVTSIGPQRDEMRFLVNNRDLRDYGSRGQGRTAILALKLGELAWMRDITGEWPVLLLDEVAAELDPHRRTYLVDQINGAEQVLLTTTEPDLLPGVFLDESTRWYVKRGTITVEGE